MNKQIEIKPNAKILFVLNICVFLSLILFKIYFSSALYYPSLINVELILNIILLTIGVIFNVLLIIKYDKYNVKKTIVIIILLFIAYIIFNTFGMHILNKPFASKYAKISNQLSCYCDDFLCDTYETIVNGRQRDFIIKKTYYDYNNALNNIEIHTYYNTEEIISIQAIIYSQSNLFSESLIKEELDGYFSKFDKNIDETLIKKAFDNRFKSSIEYENFIYKVSEIYENDNLTKLKTEVTLNFKN